MSSKLNKGRKIFANTNSSGYLVRPPPWAEGRVQAQRWRQEGPRAGAPWLPGLQASLCPAQMRAHVGGGGGRHHLKSLTVQVVTQAHSTEHQRPSRSPEATVTTWQVGPRAWVPGLSLHCSPTDILRHGQTRLFSPFPSLLTPTTSRSSCWFAKQPGTRLGCQISELGGLGGD